MSVNPRINAEGRATTVAPAPEADSPRLPGNGLTAAKLTDGEMNGNIPSPQKQTARGQEQPLAPRLAPTEALDRVREEFGMRSDASARDLGEAKPTLSPGLPLQARHSKSAMQLEQLLRAPGAALTTSGEIEPTLQTLPSKAANTPVPAAPLPIALSANRENAARYDVYARMTPETQVSVTADPLPISTRPTQEIGAGTVSPQPVPVNTFSYVAVESQAHGDTQQSPAKQSLTLSQQVALAQISKVDDPLTQQVLRGLTAQRLQDGVVRIQLTPANLGHIDVRIQHADQQEMQISMLVREGQTRELLEQVAPKIRANLSQMGVEIGDLDIRQGRKDDSERRQYTPPVVDPSPEHEAEGARPYAGRPTETR
ncbi:MAG: flagellar hook-length control protein FliK [Pseudomonadota bacterium]